MNYVDSYNFYGVDSKQIPCILGDKAPETTTEGAVGCLYMDTSTAGIYACVSAEKGEFIWIAITSSLEKRVAKLEDDTSSFCSIAYVSLASSKWQGTGSPYSQVVSIDGVTKNSRVDLNPSVDQLAIFHEKDITFVTENVDGVVTVYCIGQKPADNYLMQVTITEVTANG